MKADLIFNNLEIMFLSKEMKARTRKGEKVTHTTAGCTTLLRSSVTAQHLRCSFRSLHALLKCSSVAIVEGGEILPRFFSLHSNDLWPIVTNEAPHYLEVVNGGEEKEENPHER